MYRNMPQSNWMLGRYQRPDGESFDLSVRFYETPADMDYWSAVYDAHHETWKHMAFQLVIPKKVALTPQLAEALVRGASLDQVKAFLNESRPDGRDLQPVFSYDGWMMF